MLQRLRRFAAQKSLRGAGRTQVRQGRVSRSPIGLESLESIQLLSADPVLRWNQVALDAIAADYAIGKDPDQKGPGATARALAIVHAAIFDTVNAIEPRYKPFQVKLTAPNANLHVAVARAAHDTLVALYPSQKSTFNDALRQDLRARPYGARDLTGAILGCMVARRILAARMHDGSDDQTAYVAPNLPGVFQTFPGEMQALGPTWGSVTPFVLGNMADFSVAPPPALNSVAYADAYNEVKRLGGDGVNTPTERTDEQTEIGIFWGYDGVPGLGTPPRLYNQITRVIAQQQGNSVIENARLFALVNLAMVDAGIASWKSKYEYVLWRPDHAIPQLDPSGQPLDDGNPLTEADPSWKPLGSQNTNMPKDMRGFTPPFPAYVSGHATFGAALFTTLQLFYDRDDLSFTVTSDEYNGVSVGADGKVRPLKPRSFDSFSEASAENARSRIYLGVHWSFDADHGISLGNEVAKYVFSHALQPA